MKRFPSSNGSTGTPPPPPFLRSKRRRDATYSAEELHSGGPNDANDLNASFRRSTSDPVFRRSSLSSLSTTSSIQIVQRSDSKAVKNTIAKIEYVCQQAHAPPPSIPLQIYSQAPASPAASPNGFIVQAPETECAMLAQWATDAYYKVVISKYNGIPAICDAMELFSNHVNLQASCCTALGRLTIAQSPNQMHPQHITNPTAPSAPGGDPSINQRIVSLIIRAMKTHPQSILVQSAACEALRNQSLLILKQMTFRDERRTSPQLTINSTISLDPSTSPTTPTNCMMLPTALSGCKLGGEAIVVEDLIQLLERARAMYITPSGHVSATDLLGILHKALEAVYTPQASGDGLPTNNDMSMTY